MRKRKIALALAFTLAFTAVPAEGFVYAEEIPAAEAAVEMPMAETEAGPSTAEVVAETEAEVPAVEVVAEMEEEVSAAEIPVAEVTMETEALTTETSVAEISEEIQSSAEIAIEEETPAVNTDYLEEAELILGEEELILDASAEMTLLDSAEQQESEDIDRIKVESICLYDVQEVYTVQELERGIDIRAEVTYTDGTTETVNGLQSQAYLPKSGEVLYPTLQDENGLVSMDFYRTIPVGPMNVIVEVLYQNEYTGVRATQPVTIKGFEPKQEMTLGTVIEYNMAEAQEERLYSFVPAETGNYKLKIVNNECEVTARLYKVSGDQITVIDRYQLGYDNTCTAATALEAGTEYILRIINEYGSSCGTAVFSNKKEVTGVSLAAPETYNALRFLPGMEGITATVEYTDGSTEVVNQWKSGEEYDENTDQYIGRMFDYTEEGERVYLRLLDENGNEVSVPKDTLGYGGIPVGSFRLKAELKEFESPERDFQICFPEDAQNLAVGEKLNFELGRHGVQSYLFTSQKAGEYTITIANEGADVRACYNYRYSEEGQHHRIQVGGDYSLVEGYPGITLIEGYPGMIDLTVNGAGEKYLVILKEIDGLDAGGSIWVEEVQQQTETESESEHESEKKQIVSASMDSQTEYNVYTSKSDLVKTEAVIEYEDGTEDILDTWYGTTRNGSYCFEGWCENAGKHIQLSLYKDDIQVNMPNGETDWERLPVGTFTLKMQCDGEVLAEKTITISIPEAEEIIPGQEYSVTAPAVYKFTADEQKNGKYVLDTKDIWSKVYKYQEDNLRYDYNWDNGLVEWVTCENGKTYYIYFQGENGSTQGSFRMIPETDTRVDNITFAGNTSDIELIEGLDAWWLRTWPQVQLTYQDGSSKIIDIDGSDIYERGIQPIIYCADTDGTPNLEETRSFYQIGELPAGVYFLGASISSGTWQAAIQDPLKLTILSKSEAAKKNTFTEEASAVDMESEYSSYASALYTAPEDGRYIITLNVCDILEIRVFDMQEGEVDVDQTSSCEYRVSLTGGQQYIIAARWDIDSAEARNSFAMSVCRSNDIVEVQAGCRKEKLIAGLDGIDAAGVFADITYADGSRVRLEGANPDAEGNQFRYELTDENNELITTNEKLSTGSYRLTAIQNTESGDAVRSSNEVELNVELLDIETLQTISENVVFNIQGAGKYHLFSFTPENDGHYIINAGERSVCQWYEDTDSGLKRVDGKKLKAGITYVLCLQIYTDSQEVTVRLTEGKTPVSIQTILTSAAAKGLPREFAEIIDINDIFDIEITYADGTTAKVVGEADLYGNDIWYTKAEKSYTDTTETYRYSIRCGDLEQGIASARKSAEYTFTDTDTCGAMELEEGISRETAISSARYEVYRFMPEESGKYYLTIDKNVNANWESVWINRINENSGSVGQIIEGNMFKLETGETCEIIIYWNGYEPEGDPYSISVEKYVPVQKMVLKTCPESVIKGKISPTGLSADVTFANGQTKTIVMNDDWPYNKENYGNMLLFDWKELSEDKIRLYMHCGNYRVFCDVAYKDEDDDPCALGHSLTHHEAVAATCTTAGSAAYYGCSRCKKYFSDAAGTKELAASDLTTAALGHSPTYHAAVAATCTTAGNVAYYSCSRCKKYFSDAAGTKELAASSLTTKALGHSMTYHKAVAATCTTAGNVAYYSCSRCKKYFSDAAGTKALAASSLTVAAAGHRWGAWTTTAAATVFAPQKQVRRCSGCGLSESRNYGSKLKATVTLTASSLVMKTKQTTAAFKASGFAKGDYLQSVVSSNTKILRVTNVNRNGTFKLTAQKTAGSANLTIRLASGLTKIVKVTVQKKNVKTTAIGGVAKSLKLAKGKTATLKPVLSPVTSQDKITYSTSNKKVATVSSKGVIKGIKAGTARITVKSGSKKFVCTVTVPATKTTNITGVKASVTLKKGKKLTLKPKLTPSNSDEKITYATSNKKVATVTSKGVIKGVKKGTAVITVKSGSKRVTCKVTVK
ncbi:MAG: Ig-like domain-containing protein [Eubacteriales bacterium]|nr:Ig-like domain-containing protein [Eubacteriales bacterium]